MKYVFFMCKDLNPFSPSLTRIKNIELPGYTSPVKVIIIVIIKHVSSEPFLQFSASDGMPFYMNLPSIILKRSLARKDVAEQLNRYPVHTETHCRYCGYS